MSSVPPSFCDFLRILRRPANIGRKYPCCNDYAHWYNDNTMTTSNIAGAIDALKREIDKERGELDKVERELATHQSEVRKLEDARNKIRAEHSNHERELSKLQTELQSLSDKH